MRNVKTHKDQTYKEMFLFLNLKPLNVSSRDKCTHNAMITLRNPLKHIRGSRL